MSVMHLKLLQNSSSSGLQSNLNKESFVTIHTRTMEGFVDQYEKENMSMKLVMLKQEETFRQQVGHVSSSD